MGKRIPINERNDHIRIWAALGSPFLLSFSGILGLKIKEEEKMSSIIGMKDGGYLAADMRNNNLILQRISKDGKNIGAQVTINEKELISLYNSNVPSENK